LISSIAQERQKEQFHEQWKRFAVPVEAAGGGHDPGVFLMEIKRHKGEKI